MAGCSIGVMMPDRVGQGVEAGDLIKEMSPIVCGNDSGRTDLAQDGGTDAGKIGEAVTAAKNRLTSQLC